MLFSIKKVIKKVLRMCLPLNNFNHKSKKNKNFHNNKHHSEKQVLSISTNIFKTESPLRISFCLVPDLVLAKNSNFKNILASNNLRF